jgi:hypothetical protein
MSDGVTWFVCGCPECTSPHPCTKRRWGDWPVTFGRTATEAELVPREPCAGWNCESNGGLMRPPARSGHRIHALPNDVDALPSRTRHASQRRPLRARDGVAERSRAATCGVQSILETQRPSDPLSEVTNGAHQRRKCKSRRQCRRYEIARSNRRRCNKVLGDGRHGDATPFIQASRLIR